MNDLPYCLERSVLICAQRKTVFRYFTDSNLFAEWWGAGSSIEGRRGGRVKIVYPNGVVASGSVVEAVGDERIIFTYGYEDASKPIPPGGSRVTVVLHDHPGGTLLTLKHELADEQTRDHHVPGWRYQLALFANAAANRDHANLGAVIDGYFALWAEKDSATRRRLLDSLAAPDLIFQDRFGCTQGRDDLDAHVAASQMHMPGVTLRRSGEPRHCQGTAIADWEAYAPDGKTLARGSNVFVMSPDGRIARVVGFWS